MLKQCIFLLVSCFISTAALQAQVTHWKIQSDKLAGSIQIEFEQSFALEVAANTHHQLIIEVLPPKGFVPIRSGFNATRRNIIQGLFMSPQYWGAADPVFAIMGDLVTAWNQPREYYRWLNEEQGIKYLEHSYHQFDLKLLGYMVSPMESMVSNSSLNSIDDFVGQRLRTPPGMVFDYFKMIGAKPRLIDVNQVDKALKKKQISLADYSNLVVNYKEGLYQHNKYTNFPGFHSMPLLDFVVNQQAWDSISPVQQQVVTKALARWQQSLQLYFDLNLMRTMQEIQDSGVKVSNWPPSQRVEARRRALPIWRKYAAQSPTATGLIEQLITWLEQIGNL